MQAAQRLQLIEVKFYEERLHIQQKHDAAVQKVSLPIITVDS